MPTDVLARSITGAHPLDEIQVKPLVQIPDSFRAEDSQWSGDLPVTQFISLILLSMGHSITLSLTKSGVDSTTESLNSKIQDGDFCNYAEGAVRLYDIL